MENYVIVIIQYVLLMNGAESEIIVAIQLFAE
jgi:hypothetical protein